MHGDNAVFSTCQAHGACFNLGEDAEGNTLISWSALHALYTLPDGSIWAEHSDFIDSSDMVRLATAQPVQGVLYLKGMTDGCASAVLVMLVTATSSRLTLSRSSSLQLTRSVQHVRAQISRQQLLRGQGLRAQQADGCGAGRAGQKGGQGSISNS